MLTDLIELETIVESVDGSTIILADAAGLEVGDRVVIESQHGYGEPGLDGVYEIKGARPKGTFYYTDEPIGKSFLATVKSASGREITLDRNVPAAAVGRTLYRDNEAAVRYALENLSLWPKNQKFAVACWTQPLFVRIPNDQATIDFNGCELFSPRGVPSISIVPYSTDPKSLASCNKVWKNLTLRGNARTSGFGLVVIDKQWSIPAALKLSGTTGPYSSWVKNVRAENIRFIDNFYSFPVQLASDVVVKDCVATFTDHLKAYIGWEFQAASCRDVRFENCAVDSDFARCGFEAFGCDGGVVFSSCVGRNAVYSINSSGGVLFDRCSVVWDEENPDPGFSQYSPSLNINRNIENQNDWTYATGGIRVRDFSVEYRKLPYPEKKQILQAVTIAPNSGADIQGVTLKVPSADVQPPNPTGYLVRSDDPKSRASGFYGDTLPGIRYAKLDVDSPPDPEPNMKVADINLTWTPSVSSDVDKQRIVAKVDGNEKANKELTKDANAFALTAVPAGSSVEYTVFTIDAEGKETASQPCAFDLGDLVAPLPATGLGYSIVKVYDVN